MATITAWAINNAAYVEVHNLTIHRYPTVVNLGYLPRDSINGLIQEFEEKRLSMSLTDAATLFTAAGLLLNAEGTGSAGPINGSYDAYDDDVDDELRAEIGSRETNYINVFNAALSL